ncbi:hypothetical protein JTB14_033036 [Gonioctena quinquepunctata]|nr:hypothetical protein JTB14_033036 [Gonioctena quinquepunctata]
MLFAHLNLRSIFTGFDALENYIVPRNIDVFGGSETWLHENVDVTPFFIEQYQLEGVDRDGRNTIRYEVILREVTRNIEQLWVKIRADGKCFITGVLYRPPKSNILDFFGCLDNTVSQLLPECDKS